ADADLLAAARRGRRWVLVGEPAPSETRDARRETRDGRAKRRPAPGFARLWDLLHCDPWGREGERGVCRLRPVPPAARGRPGRAASRRWSSAGPRAGTGSGPRRGAAGTPAGTGRAGPSAWRRRTAWRPGWPRSSANCSEYFSPLPRGTRLRVARERGEPSNSS